MHVWICDVYDSTWTRNSIKLTDRAFSCLPTSCTIRISSSALVTISDLIQLAVSNLIRLTIFEWIRLSFSDLIWLTFNIFIFISSHIIWVPFQSSFRESHIFQGVLHIIQHLNCGLFHDSENSIYFWWEHSNFPKNQIRERRIRTNPPPPQSQFSDNIYIYIYIDWVIGNTGELCRPKGESELNGRTPWKMSVIIFRLWIIPNFEHM